MNDLLSIQSQLREDLDACSTTRTQPAGGLGLGLDTAETALFALDKEETIECLVRENRNLRSLEDTFKRQLQDGKRQLERMSQDLQDVITERDHLVDEVHVIFDQFAYVSCLQYLHGCVCARSMIS